MQPFTPFSPPPSLALITQGNQYVQQPNNPPPFLHLLGHKSAACHLINRWYPQLTHLHSDMVGHQHFVLLLYCQFYPQVTIGKVGPIIAMFIFANASVVLDFH